ncbi:MAG: 2-dehydropantoate 2-reductase [Burkholderiales bacterium]
MKTCIVGLGAIGGFVAHRLVEGGQPVSALARGATLAAVRRNGLVLRDAADPERGRAVSIAASDSPAELGPQDLVVLAVKTTALPSIPASIAPLLGPYTVVLSAMNGVPWWFFHGLGERWQGTRLEATDADGSLSHAVPPARVVGCVVHMSASMSEPGVVRHAFGDRFIVGEPGGGATPRLAAVADLLRAARLQVEVSPRIELDVWLKLWGNMTMNPVSALTGATMDRILDDPLLRRFVSDAMVEARAIGDALGLPIAMTPEERHVITRKLGAVRTSMLQDVDAGRPIELDALIGSVSEMGRLVGVDTPNIDALLGLTRLFGRVRGLVPPA